jgi:hypothetical protein
MYIRMIHTYDMGLGIHTHTCMYVTYVHTYVCFTHIYIYIRIYILDTGMLAENQGFNVKGEKIARKDHLYGTGAK